MNDYINKRILLALLMLSVLLFQGCASKIGIKSNPANGQKTEFEEGVEAIVSTKKNIVIVRPVSTTFQKRPSFIVSMKNGTSSHVSFSTQNISAKNNNKSLKIFTYNELVAKINRKKASEAAAVKSRSNRVTTAGNQYQYGSYNKRTATARSYGTYNGYAVGSTTSRQEQAASRTEKDQDLQRITVNTESALQNLSKISLQQRIVAPKTWHGGYIKLGKTALKQGQNTISLVVDVAGEQHLFDFVLNRAR